jgi:hypothetical protein
MLYRCHAASEGVDGAPSVDIARKDCGNDDMREKLRLLEEAHIHFAADVLTSIVQRLPSAGTQTSIMN